MLPDPYNKIPKSSQYCQLTDEKQTIFHQGEISSGLYIVLSGAVQLERVGPSGERFIIHRAPAGTSFAEASVFSERYHCDAVVRTSGEVLRIDKRAILNAFADIDFAQAFGRSAARQVQFQRQLIEIVGIRSAEERVLAGLVAGLHQGTVVDFAALIHLSHEATYRALRSLVRAGSITNPSRGLYHVVSRRG